MPVGYSGKPLGQKLGLKEGFKILVLNPPETYWPALGPLPVRLVVHQDLDATFDFIHVFARQREELETSLPALRNAIAANGMIWVSWPKRSSGVQTNLTEDVVRDVALRNRLVDVKVCAIDEIWSGLKLVVRVKDR